MKADRRFPPRSPRGSRWRAGDADALDADVGSNASIGDALSRAAGRAPAAAARATSTAATPSTRASSTRPAFGVDALRFPDDLADAAADDQGRADRRPGGAPAVGHGAHRADRALHALLPDVVDDRAGRCAGSTPTRAGSGCSTAGRRSIAPRGVGPGDRVFFPFSFGPFLGFWTAFEAGCQMGAALRARRRHVEPAAAGDDRRRRRRRSSAARRPTRCGWPRWPPSERPDRPLVGRAACAC